MLLWYKDWIPEHKYGCTGRKRWKVSILPALKPSSPPPSPQFSSFDSKHPAKLIFPASKTVVGATSCWWQVYNYEPVRESYCSSASDFCVVAGYLVLVSTTSGLTFTTIVSMLRLGHSKNRTRLLWENYRESNYLRGRFPLLPPPFCIHYALLA